MRYFYSAVFYCLMPFIALRMLVRSRRAPQYRRRMGERLGYFNNPLANRSVPVLWVHAVSVGETLAAAPLVEALLQRYPGHRLVLTTTTPTGSERVQALFGERVFHVYFPWDTPGAVKRFLGQISPQVLVIMETELWPNMLHYTHSAGCKIVLANARMSERSARGYAKLGRFSAAMLKKLDVVACQSVPDGERFVSLGLPPSVLHVTGSIKFDVQLDDALVATAKRLREDFGGAERPILVAASTHAGEEEQILRAYSVVKRSFPHALLILVPRHPERFTGVGKLCVDAGWRMKTRSSGMCPVASDDIVLGDTMGELLLLLGTADIALIGGSLVPHGGHNVLEASVWGVPVVTGPHMFNFADISELLTRAGAMIMLPEGGDLGEMLVDLLADVPRREQMGSVGLGVVAANGGALELQLALIRQCVTGP